MFQDVLYCQWIKEAEGINEETIFNAEHKKRLFYSQNHKHSDPIFMWAPMQF